MIEEIQGSWGLNEIEIITRSGFSFFSTFFKATSLGIAICSELSRVHGFGGFETRLKFINFGLWLNIDAFLF